MKNEDRKAYNVVKTNPSHPGPGLKTSVPESEMVMSRHRSRPAAEKALRSYERSHKGYASFRIEAE